MKKHFRQLFCLVLSVILLLPSLVVSHAESPKAENSFTVMDGTGKEMYFETVDDGQGGCTIYYYFDGKLVSTYKITKGSPEIKVRDADGTEYTIQSDFDSESSSLLHPSSNSK